MAKEHKCNSNLTSQQLKFNLIDDGFPICKLILKRNVLSLMCKLMYSYIRDVCNEPCKHEGEGERQRVCIVKFDE